MCVINIGLFCKEQKIEVKMSFFVLEKDENIGH